MKKKQRANKLVLALSAAAVIAIGDAAIAQAAEAPRAVGPPIAAESGTNNANQSDATTPNGVANSNSNNGDTPGGGANQSGPYDPNPGVGSKEPGVGDGEAVGMPDAGTVGSADTKNPPGQMPGGQDPNRGYECDRNPGVGDGNPAHTGCQTSVDETPAETPTEIPVETPTEIPVDGQLNLVVKEVVTPAPAATLSAVASAEAAGEGQASGSGEASSSVPSALQAQRMLPSTGGVSPLLLAAGSGLLALAAGLGRLLAFAKRRNK